MARATLAPRLGMTAPVPPLRPRPTLTMKDMGMGGMDHGSMAGMDHGAMAAGASAAAGHGNSHSMSGMNMRDKSLVPDSVKVGDGVDAIAMSPIDRNVDTGVGVADVGPKELTYPHLISCTPPPATSTPQRTSEGQLTHTTDARKNDMQ